jgi:hypothetical protein
MALNGGPMPFKFNESISFAVRCESQEEIDYYWEKLLGPGQKCQCGWPGHLKVAPESSIETMGPSSASWPTSRNMTGTSPS